MIEHRTTCCWGVVSPAARDARSLSNRVLNSERDSFMPARRRQCQAMARLPELTAFSNSLGKTDFLTRSKNSGPDFRLNFRLLRD